MNMKNMNIEETDNKLIVNIVASHISERNRDEYIKLKLKCVVRLQYNKKYRLYQKLLKMNTHYPNYEDKYKEYNYYNNLWLKYKAGEYELIVS